MVDTSPDRKQLRRKILGTSVCAGLFLSLFAAFFAMLLGFKMRAGPVPALAVMFLFAFIWTVRRWMNLVRLYRESAGTACTEKDEAPEHQAFRACEEDALASQRGELSWNDAVDRTSRRRSLSREDAADMLRDILLMKRLGCEARDRYMAGANPDGVFEYLLQKLAEASFMGEGGVDRESGKWMICKDVARKGAHHALWEAMADIWDGRRRELAESQTTLEKLHDLRRVSVPETLARRTLFAAEVMKEKMKDFPQMAAYAHTLNPEYTQEPDLDWPAVSVRRLEAIRLTAIVHQWEPWTVEAIARRRKWGEGWGDIAGDLLACGFAPARVREVAGGALKQLTQRARRICRIGAALGIAGTAACLPLLKMYTFVDIAYLLIPFAAAAVLCPVFLLSIEIGHLVNKRAIESVADR